MVDRPARSFSARLRRHRLVAVLGAVLLLAAGVWGVKLVRISSSVEVYRTYWAEPRGQPGGLVYVTLGDSAAQGIGASGPDRGQRVWADAFWTELRRSPPLTTGLD